MKHAVQDTKIRVTSDKADDARQIQRQLKSDFAHMQQSTDADRCPRDFEQPVYDVLLAWTAAFSDHSATASACADRTARCSNTGTAPSGSVAPPVDENVPDNPGQSLCLFFNDRLHTRQQGGLGPWNSQYRYRQTNRSMGVAQLLGDQGEKFRVSAPYLRCRRKQILRAERGQEEALVGVAQIPLSLCACSKFTNSGWALGR